MDKKYIPFARALGIFLLIALFIAPVAAKTPKGKGQQYPPAFLEGQRIIVWDVNHTREADESCYVIHGFKAYWMENTPEEKLQYLRGEYEFRLTINGYQVELTKFRHFFLVRERAMLFTWYVQFDAGFFSPGLTYEFVGEWIKPGETNYRTSFVTFT